MSPEASQPPNYIKLTEEQAASIVEQSYDHEISAEEILAAHELGSIALGENVAVVVKTDENGIETASHLLNIGPDDFGTHIRTDDEAPMGPRNRERFGTAEEALRSINEKEQAQDSEISAASTSEKKDKFAYLFEPAEQVNIGKGSELTAPNETEPNARITELFAPRLTKSERPIAEPTTDEENVEKYVRMLQGTEEPEPKISLQEKIAKENEEAKYVDTPTEEQVNAAATRLRDAMSRDPIIDAIVNKYTNQDSWRNNEIVNIVRKNPDLRYELGSYLLRDKIPTIQRERPHDLPDRVFVGRQKNANHRGYAHLGYLNSQEYAAMLALSMIDGTYKQPGPGDPIERNKEGYIAVGQHRAAAHILLGEDSYRIGR